MSSNQLQKKMTIYIFCDVRHEIVQYSPQLVYF